MKFNKLSNGDKVVDIIQDNGKRLDGQVLEYYKSADGKEYLCSKESMWELCQFNENDYEVYKGSLSAGEYIK